MKTRQLLNGVVVDVDLPDYTPSAEEIREQKLAEIESLKAQLASTDYKAIKFAEGWLTADEYEPIKSQRQSLRDRINELEKEVSHEG